MFAPSTSKTLLMIIAGGLGLSSAALYNGYPLLFTDTPAHLAVPQPGAAYWARPVYYSLFAYPLHLGKTLWPVVAAQSLAVAHLVYLVQRALVGRVEAPAYLLVICVLTLFSSLPWQTGYLLADVFAGVVILTLYLLGFASDRLSRAETAYVVLLCVLATVTHLSHLPLAIGLVLVIATLRAATGRWSGPHGASAALPAVPIVVSLAALFWSNAHYHGVASATGHGHIITLARFIADGPALDHLREECPEQPYVLCDQLDSLGGRSVAQLLWFGGDSIVERAGGADALRAEAWEIALGSMSTRPLAHLKAAARNTLHQLIRFRTGDGMVPYRLNDPDRAWVAKRLTQSFPSDREALVGARQYSGRLGLDAINGVHRIALWVAVLVGLNALAWAVRLRAHDVTILIGVITAGLLGNALITGTFSGVHDRYQSRVVWLIVLASILSVLHLLERMRAGSPARSAVRLLPALGPASPSPGGRT